MFLLQLYYLHEKCMKEVLLQDENSARIECAQSASNVISSAIKKSLQSLEAKFPRFLWIVPSCTNWVFRKSQGLCLHFYLVCRLVGVKNFTHFFWFLRVRDFLGQVKVSDFIFNKLLFMNRNLIQTHAFMLINIW